MTASSPTLQSFLINVLKKHRNRVFSYMDGKMSLYWDVDRVSSRVANGIRTLGYKPGDRIAVTMSNRIECPMAILGVMKSGATFTGLNPMMAEADMGYILQDADIKMVFVDEAAVDKIIKLEPQCPSLKHVVVVGAATSQGLESWTAFTGGQTSKTPYPMPVPMMSSTLPTRAGQRANLKESSTARAVFSST